MHAVYTPPMAVPERSLIDARLLALTPTERRFRLYAGQAWQGEAVRASSPTRVTLYPGDVLLRRARAFHGAPVGFPDLFGWDAVIVTPEMVGTVVAIATGEEVKTGSLRLSAMQRRFRECLTGMGGRFVTVREPQRPPPRPARRTVPAPHAMG